MATAKTTTKKTTEKASAAKTAVKKTTVVIANMFNEKEDFMLKLFGISGRTQESIDYWGE